jgi:penicillin G amidase
VPGWTGEHDWTGMVPFERMPRVDDPERGYLATANNRVTADGGADYLCTDAHPPHRARRIEQLLDPLTAATPDDMRAIHRDDLSQPAREFVTALAALDLPPGPAAAVRDRIAGWDARLAPGSVAATDYTRFRWALAALLVERSGQAGPLLAAVPPAVSPVSQFWWTLPTLLRTGDTALLGGWTWPQALTAALEQVAGEPEQEWSALHRVRLQHPLAPYFPDAAATLQPLSVGVGGDNECVWANGARWESRGTAVYGAVARYVYDVGNWDECGWVVLGGASGDPASPHYTDQHTPWSTCDLVPMLYTWPRIAAESTRTDLLTSR